MTGGLRVLIGIVVLLVNVVATGAVADAQDKNQAGIVIRFDDEIFTYVVVPFSETEISGIDLLSRSSVPLVTVEFGGLGQAVCTLDGQGCGVSDCRQNLCQDSGGSSPYWRYFQFVDGNWVAAPLGASSSTVQDGTIDGWSWTSDESLLPVVDMAEIQQMAGAPAEPSEAVAVTYRNGEPYERADNSVQSPWILLAGGVLIGGLLVAVVLRNRHRKSAR